MKLSKTEKNTLKRVGSRVPGDYASSSSILGGLTSKSLKFSRDGQSTDESMSPDGVLMRITMASVSMSCRLFKLTKSIKRKVDASY